LDSKAISLTQKVMQGHPKRTARRNGTNLEHAHLLNQRVILEAVRLRGPVSRVEIARIVGLTNQSVFNIVDGLQRADLIHECGVKTAGRGLPARLFEINPDGVFSIGVHLECDHITAVLVDFKGAIRVRAHRDHYQSTPDEARRQALSSVRELQRKNNRRRIWGIGIALPGPTDSRSGKVLYLPNFPGWEEFNVRDYFSGKTGLRVLVDNDATAAAIGESWEGVGRNLNNFFYIYIGIGVGGGIVVDGRPYRGYHGNSGELGHVIVNRRADAKICGCGKKGCLEAYTSLTSLLLNLKEVGIETDLPSLVKLFEARNKSVMAWLETAASFLCETIGNLQLLFDPEAFVIGGHLPAPLLIFLSERCSNFVASAKNPKGTNPPRLLQGTLHDEAAAIGAAALPMRDIIAPDYESITGGGHLSLLKS
jgi:predicted NBD/HSP70 family sugar kinase